MSGQRSAPVPEAAVRELLRALDVCFGGPAPWHSLVDVPVAAAEARRFKIDVSFALARERMARFSINDKGEPEALRARLRACGLLGLPRDELEAFLAVSAPGEVQTTLGVKWLAGVAEPDRVSLYFEELACHPRGGDIRREAVRLAGGEAPELAPGAVPNAVAVEWRRGDMVGSKVYDVFCERPADQPVRLPDGLGELRDRLPFHADMGTRRYMLATRLQRGGALAGHKLLWMTELHRPELCERVWGEVDRFAGAWGGAVDATVLSALRSVKTAFDGFDVFPFPDLVAFNIDAAGLRQALIVHVSIR